jgi:CMP-N-acetylneuraminic acid synthetase
MIAGKTVMAIIPARGGSKGIRLKNLRSLDGVSLVARAIRVASATPEVDRVVISTDHEEIAAAARKEGCEVPFMRPDALSGDRVADHPVLVDALAQAEEHYKEQYDFVLMLQPTSPFRTPEYISGALSMLTEDGFDAVWSVSESDSKAHPLKQLTVNKNQLGYYDNAGKDIIARQQLTPVYHRNGVVYAFTRDCLVGQKTIFGKNTGAYVIDDFQLSIDTEHDLELAEFFMKGKNS